MDVGIERVLRYVSCSSTMPKIHMRVRNVGARALTAARESRTRAHLLSCGLLIAMLGSDARAGLPQLVIDSPRSESPAAEPLSSDAIAERQAQVLREITQLRGERQALSADSERRPQLDARLELLGEIQEILAQESRLARAPARAEDAPATAPSLESSARALLERLNEVAGSAARRASLTEALQATREALEAASQEYAESERERRRLAEVLSASPPGPAPVQQDLARRELLSRLAAERVQLRRLDERVAAAALETFGQRVARAERETTAIRQQILAQPEVSSLDLVPLETRATRLQQQREKAARNLETAELRLARARERFTRGGDAASEVLENVTAQALQRDAAQQTLEVASGQLERTEQERELWTRWDAVLRGTASRAELRVWLTEVGALSESLGRQSLRSQGRVVDLQERRDGAQARMADSPPGTALRTPLRAQLDALSILVELHQGDAAQLSNELRLAQHVERDLRSGLGRISASEVLGQAWLGTQQAWRYEITIIDDLPITVGKLVVALTLFLAGLALSGVLSRWAGRLVERRLRTKDGAATAVQTLSFYILVLIFTLLALRTVHFPLTTFTVLGGALAIGVGFGSQNLMNNFISGLILMLERPIRPGDLIEVEGTHGRVERIRARSTLIRTSNGRHIVVPNSFFLENSLVNWTLSDDLIRTQIDLGVSYGSPTRTVDKLIRQALEEEPRVLTAPLPVILFASFGDNALCFEAHFWTQARGPMDLRRLESDLRFRIDELFREAGLVIAFPQRDVHLDSARPIEVRMVEHTRPSARD